MSIRTEDGTLLQAKEGIIVDAEGSPLNTTEVPRFFVQSFRLPALGAILLVPLALATGMAFILLILVLLVAYFVLRAIKRLIF